MEIILKRTFDSRIDRTLNRVLQIFGEGCDMRIVGARIGGKLLPAQFTTLPGTVERMLQDRSFTNQMIQNMQSSFDGHKATMVRRRSSKRKRKDGSRRKRVRQSSSIENASP